MRSRECINGGLLQSCPGDATEATTCNTEACPMWMPWSEWTGCSSTCGGGVMTRDRECMNGMAGNDGCMGASSESMACNTAVSWDK